MLSKFTSESHLRKTTISNTRATFAYYSFCDNLRLQCNEMNDNPMLLVVEKNSRKLNFICQNFQPGIIQRSTLTLTGKWVYEEALCL